jgi:heptosyltransferase I
MKILIVRLSAMGDVIHSLPLARNARLAGAAVGWLVERRFAGLLEGNADCAEVFTADTRRWRRNVLAPRTWREAAATRHAIAAFAPLYAVDSQGLWKSAVAARASGAKSIVGFAAAERREPASAILASLAIVPGATRRHVVDRNLTLLEAIGIPVVDRKPDASYLLKRSSPEADAFLANAPRPFAVLHPGAGWPDKEWGEDRFAALARGLAKAGFPSVISWGPGDEARVQKLRRLVPEALVPPLLDFAGLARLANASALYVGGDTGPLHLADAVGAKTLALFGPTDPARNGPYRNPAGVVTRMRDVSDDTVIQRALGLLKVEGQGSRVES